MRIVIIGAGPCGLGAALRLQELGFHDFTVYEAHDYVGGLATSFEEPAGFTWDLGIHVAHSHYAYIDRLMQDLLPDGYFHHVRKSWVRLYDTFVPYPFQYNIRHLPRHALEECLQGLIDRKPAHAGQAPMNFNEWILAGFGSGIARHFMAPYNRKIWRTDLDRMGTQWIGDRVPPVDVERVQRNVAQGLDDVSWGPNATFQFPKHGGTGAIWNALASRLPADKIRRSTALVSLDASKRIARFSDGTSDAYDWIISTIPLPHLTRLVGDKGLHALARQLRSTHVDIVGLAFPAPLPEQLRDKTWLYCPEDRAGFYRATPFSLLSPDHVPDAERWCTFVCETSTEGSATLQHPSVVRDTIDGLHALGLSPRNTLPAHTFHRTLEFGYPVPTVDRDPILSKLLPGLEGLNILSRGRFGGWKYEVSNMDHSVMQGVEAAERLVAGTPEITLFDPAAVNAGKR